MITWPENIHLWTQPTLVAIPIIPSSKKSKLQIFLPRNICESCHSSTVLFNNMDQTTCIFKRCLSLFSFLLFTSESWNEAIDSILYIIIIIILLVLFVFYERKEHHCIIQFNQVPFSLFSTSDLDSVAFVIHKKHNEGAFCQFWYILC